MNKKLLIISATSRNNFELAKQIDTIAESFSIEKKLINLEDYNIPIYTPIKQAEGIPEEVSELTIKFINSSGFIFCVPEYNGSIPPILTNLIAWISVSTDKRREVFNGKKALLASHSGGGGHNLIQSLRIQLNHLGTIVLPRTIIVNSYTKFDLDSTKNKIQQLIKLL
ncbi:MAG: NAD(P)H-dependent oxidoreductase [Candidatus Marinimicrobia bacterium]|nr:NAD(P)H-dependent oxidoreductase [Candidatus Neomarinimicrobiota bacterium]